MVPSILLLSLYSSLLVRVTRGLLAPLGSIATLEVAEGHGKLLKRRVLLLLLLLLLLLNIASINRPRSGYFTMIGRP